MEIVLQLRQYGSPSLPVDFGCLIRLHRHARPRCTERTVSPDWDLPRQQCVLDHVYPHGTEAYAESKTTDAGSLLSSPRSDTALLVETESQNPPSSSNVEKNESRSSGESNPGSTEGRSFTRSVPVDHLELGDHIVIAPGALPPTDGIIVSGSTTFDESSLTGESKPVTKQPGDEIFTGTVNITSAITVQVTRLASPSHSAFWPFGLVLLLLVASAQTSMQQEEAKSVSQSSLRSPPSS